MGGHLRFLWVLVPLVILGAASRTGEAEAVVPAETPHGEERAPEVVAAPVAVPEPPPPEARRFAKIVEDISRTHGVDAALVHALILAESSYDPDAISGAGASGLMQLMPETAKRHGVRDPFDPADNIRGGVKHLKQLLALFDGDVELAIAAYNAGENAVIRAGYRIPPYAETERFVPRVIGHYRRLQLRQG